MARDGFGAWLDRFLGNPAALGPGPRDRTEGAQIKRTVCCFCSCGCGMEARVRDGELLTLEGDRLNPINEGTLCAKGAAAVGLHRHPDRLTQPLVRRPGEASWDPASWDEAVETIADRLYQLRDDSWEGPLGRTDALAFLGGAVNTNEEAYLFKKLGVLLGLLGIEHQARI